MSENNKIKVFEDKNVRMEWNADEQDWYVSIIDVIEVLTGTENPRRYWSDLKRKLKAEGSQLYEEIVQLKMIASDGRKRLTDVANTEQLLRIIQSIPSPKAEPFKLWLIFRLLSGSKEAKLIRNDPISADDGGWHEKKRVSNFRV